VELTGSSNGDGPALGYARPYEMHITREPEDSSAIQALVRHVYGVGPNVKLELQRNDSGALLEAEISRSHFNHLDLKLGDTVYVTPRNLRVFSEDYSI
jgi:sulfate/thiosulfate transport system ATP-binding protein